MNSLSLPVVHPAFQNLKRSGRLLHLVAAGLILAHAISHFRKPDTDPLYSGCLVFIALDIIILVLAFRNVLKDLPKVNLFFRSIEILFFIGIGIAMFFESNWVTGSLHIGLSVAYAFLLYCERKLKTEECIAIFHTGVSIPALPDNKFLLWSRINRIEARYDSLIIDVSSNKCYQFELQHNLAFEELDQIHEFCRHYLGDSH